MTFGTVVAAAFFRSTAVPSGREIFMALVIRGVKLEAPPESPPNGPCDDGCDVKEGPGCIAGGRTGVDGKVEGIEAFDGVACPGLIKLGGRVGGVGTGLGPPLPERPMVCGEGEGWGTPASGACPGRGEIAMLKPGWF